MKRGRTAGNCNLIVEANCARCGKRFAYDPLFYVYRRYFRMAGEKRGKEHIFCSWGCLCAAQRESDAYYGAIREAREQKSRERARAYQRERARNMTPEQKERYREINRRYFEKRRKTERTRTVKKEKAQESV